MKGAYCPFCGEELEPPEYNEYTQITPYCCNYCQTCEVYPETPNNPHSRFENETGWYKPAGVYVCWGLDIPKYFKFRKNMLDE